MIKLTAYKTYDIERNKGVSHLRILLPNKTSWCWTWYTKDKIPLRIYKELKKFGLDNVQIVEIPYDYNAMHSVVNQV